MFRITYTNLLTGNREVYMNNTGMKEKFAIEEIERLEQQQQHYLSIGYPVTRNDFKKEKIVTQ